MKVETSKIVKDAALVISFGFIAQIVIKKILEYDFRNKVVLITGGSRGLGLVLAREFAKCGSHLAICARDEEHDLAPLRRRAGTSAARRANLSNARCHLRQAARTLRQTAADPPSPSGAPDWQEI